MPATVACRVEYFCYKIINSYGFTLPLTRTEVLPFYYVTSDPFNVMVCVIPATGPDDVSGIIQRTLIEAFCHEYHIRLIKVRSLILITIVFSLFLSLPVCVCVCVCLCVRACARACECLCVRVLYK